MCWPTTTRGYGLIPIAGNFILYGVTKVTYLNEKSRKVESLSKFLYIKIKHLGIQYEVNNPLLNSTEIVVTFVYFEKAIGSVDRETTVKIIR